MTEKTVTEDFRLNNKKAKNELAVYNIRKHLCHVLYCRENLLAQDGVPMRKHCEYQPYPYYTPQLSTVHHSGVALLTLDSVFKDDMRIVGGCMPPTPPTHAAHTSGLFANSAGIQPAELVDMEYATVRWIPIIYSIS